MVVTDGLHSVPILGDLLYIAAHPIDKLQRISQPTQARNNQSKAERDGQAVLSLSQGFRYPLRHIIAHPAALVIGDSSNVQDRETS